MIKLPSKALLYRDFKSTVGYIPMIFLELLIFYTSNLIVFGDSTPFKLESLYNMSYLIPCIIMLGITLILMSMSLFKYERKFHTYTLSASMPYSRTEIMTSKWLVGFYNIFIAVTFFYVTLNAILIKNFLWKTFFTEITTWYFTALLLTSGVLGLIIMIQSGNGSTWLGSFNTLLVIAFPLTILYLLMKLITPYYAVIIDDSTPFRMTLPTFAESVMKSSQALFYYIYMATGIDFTFGYSYNNSYSPLTYAFIIRWICLIIAISVSFVISLKSFSKNEYEKTGQISTVAGLEKLHCYIIAYYIGFLSFNISCVNSFYPRIDLFILLCIIMPFLLQFPVKWVFKKYNSRLV